MKKLLSFALSLVFVFTCAFSASAASPEKENALEKLKEGTTVIQHDGYTETVTIKIYKNQQDIDRVLAEANKKKQEVLDKNTNIAPLSGTDINYNLGGNACKYEPSNSKRGCTYVSGTYTVGTLNSHLTTTVTTQGDHPTKAKGQVEITRYGFVGGSQLITASNTYTQSNWSNAGDVSSFSIDQSYSGIIFLSVIYHRGLFEWNNNGSITEWQAEVKQ